MPLTISSIIATMNRPGDLEAALKSLVIQTRLPDEILVIDQSSDDVTKKLVLRMQAEDTVIGPRLKYFFQEKRSLVQARNRGMDEAKGDIWSFLDDDIVLFEDYYQKISRAFEVDPALAGISGNAKVKEAWYGRKWRLRVFLHHLFLLNHYDGKMTWSGFGHPIYEREIDRPMQVEMLPGCNMNYRRSVAQGERFDEYFKGYSYREDAEYSYRIAKKGKVLMIPDAGLWHNYSTSSRMTEAELKRMKIKNYYYVFEKFKGRNPFARILFAYSLLGLAFIDWIEYLTNRNEPKWNKFTAGVSTSFSLLKCGKHES